MCMIVPLFVSSKERAVAVLTPREKSQLFENLNIDYRVRGNYLHETAMRISEAYYVAEHPECFRKENGAIFLPNVMGLGKVRCTITNRQIMLSTRGIAAVQTFFDEKVGLPSYQSMETVFKRAGRDAGFDTRYITTKMFRKTMISWLMNCYPERQEQIAFSAGHDYTTMRSHYITFGFRKDDVKEMRAETDGWGNAI